jgi:stage II sporulation protein E
VKLKLRAVELRRQLVSGQLTQERPQLALFIGWGLNFLLGLIMANAVILGGSAPFGIAAAAQAGPGIGGLACTLGAAMGYLMTFGFSKGIKYVSAVVLVYTAGYVFQEVKVYRKIWFMPSVAAFFTLLSGFLGTMDSPVSDAGAAYMYLLTETVLAGGSTYFFRQALSTAERDTESAELRHGISVVILLSCMMISLSRVNLLGVLSLGRLAALLIVMTAAFKSGSLSGAAVGAALGIAMDIAAGGTPCYSTAYAFMGLVSGVFSKHGRLSFVVSCVISNAAAVVWSRSSGGGAAALYEAFAASVVFMLLPSSALSYVGALLRTNAATSGEAGLRRYTARRIGKMSQAFQDLYDTVDRQMTGGENDEDLSKIFDNASQTVCARCKNKSECWNKNYMDTLAVFNDLTPVIQSRGIVMKSDIPAHFLDKCQSPNELVSSINAELRARMYRARFRSRLEENRSAAYSQYADVSEILREVSEELQNAYGPDILAQRRLLRYLGGLDIDADASVFRDRSGRLHIMIESARMRSLTEDEAYLDKLSGVVGVRLCRPHGAEDCEGRLMLLEAEPLSASVGIASMKKKGETVSGDRGTYFKTDRGVLCVILSDGMGSGDDAARESVAAVRILERFLRSGVDPAVAMRMLNSMMLLKNGEEWGFATVDLMCIDLFSGETGFYKYGAAPSYIRSGKSVRRVHSESLAAGLTAGENSAPDVVKMRLKPGSLALIASDGVIAGTNDSWLRTVLCENDGKDTKALARQTLQTAVKQYGCSDDMTVLAVRIDSRE